VQAIHHTAGEFGYDFRILDAVMKVNEVQKVSIVEKVKQHYGEDLSGKTFAIWGLAFKPETDDVREAPALYIMRELANAGAQMKAYDPEAIETFKVAADPEALKSIEFVKDRESALSESDALIICTEWNEFRRPGIDKFKEKLKDPVVFDGRNLFDLDDAEAAGLTYYSVGRPTVK
jgi:UDPglucose 6-dehydrogenase